jgi:hypothetical protein
MSLNNSSKSNSPAVTVRYEQATVTHTTQFVLSANAEEVVLDCSSGPIPGEGNEQILPIHSRHALPWSAVRRLSDSLRQMIDKYEQQTATQTQIPQHSEAGLPPIEMTNVN